MATTFGTAAIGGGVTLTLGQTIGVSAFSSIAGGMASRYVNANLNNAFYGTNRNAAKEAFNPGAMLFDGVVGGTFGGLTYTGNPIYPYGRPQQTKGQQATQRALLERFKKFCDDHGLSKIGKQDASSPVDLPEEKLLQQVANNLDDSLSITKGNLKHINNNHNPNSYSQQLKYKPKTDALKELEYKSFFNKNWGSNQIEQAVNAGYNEAVKKGITSGTYTTTYNGETITIALENGKVQTAYGSYRYTYDELLNITR